jgi:fructose-1,6-bisphosphatase I
MRIAAPEIKFPCRYGIDTASKEELISSDKTVQEVCDYIGADSLGFLSIEGLKESRLVRNIASEEQSEIIEIVKSEGTFGITLDPLDGSSLIDVNLAIGTIVGIFDEGNVLEKGRKMDAAMYMLYGPLTSLVYTVKKGVHEFILDSGGEFVLARENIRIPEGKLYSPGGLRKDFIDYHKRYIEQLEEEGYKLRYSGAFVADLHQILTKGGVFTYPALKTHPKGKLRLLFEANPMCMIIREAGGAATTGKIRIEDIRPESISDRTPLYIGSMGAIERIEKIIRDQEE